MLVDLNLENTKTISDLTTGDWFVLTDSYLSLNKRVSVMCSKQHIVKVADIYLPATDTSNVSIIPIGMMTMVSLGASVIHLDNENDIVKLKEKLD